MTSLQLAPPAAPATDPRPAPFGLPTRIVAAWGSSATSPFITGPGMTPVLLANRRAVVGFAHHAGWAVAAGGVVGPPALEEHALDEYIDFLQGQLLRPVFVAVEHTEPYERRRFHTVPIADEAIVDLADFGLSGKRMANVRHSVTSAKRAGLRVVDWSPELMPGLCEVSTAWLAAKRGGEMGFTLGTFDSCLHPNTEVSIAIDGDDRVVGFATWHAYDAGHARVLDLMRRRPDAPNPTMDLIIATSLERFATQGVRKVSLAAVPSSHGRVAERIYPAASLRRYKDKFAPRWETRWLAVPRRRHLPLALRAVALAYCPGGLRSALRRNG